MQPVRNESRLIRLTRLKVERRGLPLHRAFSDARLVLPINWTVEDRAWAAIQAAERRAGWPYRFADEGPSGAQAIEILNDTEERR